MSDNPATYHLCVPVLADGLPIGEIRLHAGTHDFTITGNEGIGRVSAKAEKSGFYVHSGDLGRTAVALAAEHLNWLQIVRVQPSDHTPVYGPVPHVDPSDLVANPKPRDGNPFYLNIIPQPENPDFDVPVPSETILPFQDFPSGYSKVGDTFTFDTFLAAVVDRESRTYRVLAGFTWTVRSDYDPRTDSQRAQLRELAPLPPQLPDVYVKLVRAYGGLGWRPDGDPEREPTGVIGRLVGAAGG